MLTPCIWWVWSWGWEVAEGGFSDDDDDDDDDDDSVISVGRRRTSHFTRSIKCIYSNLINN